MVTKMATAWSAVFAIFLVAVTVAVSTHLLVICDHFHMSYVAVSSQGMSLVLILP